MSLSRTLAAAALGLTLGFGGIAAASAATTAPARAQIHHRLAQENKKIAQDVRHGRISRAQAHALHARLARIHRHVVAMARHDHLSRIRAARLAHQEKVVAHNL